ncbi:MAG TPA: DNA topoisomerase IB [Pararhizobium sp.]|nr:DNA topoisomerase IB [Pararhizobium sp.]
MDKASEHLLTADESGAPPPTVETVKAADLVYVTDEVPGITRRRAGSGFAYYDPDGNLITDLEERKRIRSLAIPPAWNDVWISSDPRGHIQATGRDDRGRKQYRYHPDWQVFREDRKFRLLLPFAQALPRIRSEVDHDLRRHRPGFEKAVAAVVLLLDRLLIRVGNPEYAEANDSYGLTTLKSRHLRIEGEHLRFRFRGKSGKVWNLDHADRRIARAIRSIQDLPGQQLFQYVDEDGTAHAVTSSDVNDYIREAAGADFTSRQFRTWAATTLCAVALAAQEPGGSKRANARTVNATLDSVARRLGNTRAVCRRSYVHPLVFETFGRGTLAEEITAAPKLAGLDADLLSEDERNVLRWLAQAANADEELG